MELSRIRSSLQKFYGACLSPPTCEACPALVESPPELCLACRNSVITLREAHCRICALPFEKGSLTEHLCQECLETPPAFQRVQSAFEFRGSLPRLLHAFKFGACFPVLVPLLEAALPSFQETVEEFSPQALVPVPLGWWRRFRRGFNQSYVLAEGLRRALGIDLPILTELQRRGTSPQARRGRDERFRAMRGVFRVSSVPSFRGRRLLVIDDVLTTGATAESLGKSLLQAGAEAVQVWTLARTGRKESK